MVFRILAFALLFAAASPSVALAQFEARAPGRAYVNVGAQYQSSNALFTPDGRSTTFAASYEQLIVSAYGEVGVIERWLTLSLSSELVRRTVLEDQGATTGFGDLRIGAWTEWARFGNFRFMSGLQLGLPTGDDEPGGVDQQTNGIAQVLPTGDGEFDVEADLQLSGSLGATGYPLRHYFIARTGYWIRTRGFSDGFVYHGELGTQVDAPILDQVWLAVRLRGVEAIDVPEGGAVSGVGVGNGVSFTTLGGELTVRLPWKLQLGIGLETPLRGRSILDGIIGRSVLGFEI